MTQPLRRLERLMFRARPALESIELDGWVLRFADGYTKRANSVNPHFGSTQPAAEKIAQCEELYGDRSLPTIFRLTPFSRPPDLDRTLADAGYRVLDRSVVMTGPIPETVSGSRAVEFVLPAAWHTGFERLRRLDDTAANTHRRIIDGTTGERIFALTQREDRPIACGLGVCVDEAVALFDLFVAEPFRRRGHGAAVVSAILNRARRHGARTALLQMHSENVTARRLYERFGLAVAYPYWYRIKGQDGAYPGAPIAAAVPSMPDVAS